MTAVRVNITAAVEIPLIANRDGQHCWTVGIQKGDKETVRMNFYFGDNDRPAHSAEISRDDWNLIVETMK